jgi:hypothetical protein
MSVRIKYDIEPEYVKPKLEDLDITVITPEEYQLASSTSVTETEEVKNREEEEKDSWYNWTLSFSMEDAETTVKGVRKFLKALNEISNTVTQLLKIIRLLSGNVNTTSTFIKHLVKLLVKELKEFIDSLTSTGIYMSLIVPEFNKTFPKYVIPTFGGYQEFIKRVNNTCLSSNDPDAPKFADEEKVGGVIIAMLGGVNDPTYLRMLVDNFKTLAKFFGFQIPYASPAANLRAIPGLYKDKGKKSIGVKLTWEAPQLPVGSFFVYRSTKGSRGVPENPKIVTLDKTRYLFTLDDPIVKIKYNILKATYSYIDFDVAENTDHFYKIYSVYGDDYLEENSFLKYINSPVATRVVRAQVQRECIPVSELDKHANIGINGEILSPFDFEGEWQSATVRRMLGNQIDDMCNGLDALADKINGLVDTGSEAINKYLDFYKERLEDFLDIINKLRAVIEKLTDFSMKGTFMVLNLPLEEGGMRGFVDRFNEACNSGNSSSQTSGGDLTIDEFLKQSVSIEKNTAIRTFNEKGIMFGLILLYGIPDFTNEDRVKEFSLKGDINNMKRNFQKTEKAISTFLKMLGLQ